MNQALVPDKFKVVAKQDRWYDPEPEGTHFRHLRRIRGCRIYACTACGWFTPLVADGTELNAAIATHTCEESA